MNMREVTFLQHKQKILAKIFILCPQRCNGDAVAVQCVKKQNFKQLITFNINFNWKY